MKVKQKLLRTCFCAGFVLWRILRIIVLNFYVRSYSSKSCKPASLCVCNSRNLFSQYSNSIQQCLCEACRLVVVFMRTLKTLYSCSTQPVHALRSRKRRSKGIIILFTAVLRNQYAGNMLHFDYISSQVA